MIGKKPLIARLNAQEDKAWIFAFNYYLEMPKKAKFKPTV